MDRKTLAGIGAATILAGGGGVVVTDEIINPYTDKGTTLEVREESVMEEAGEIVVELVKNKPEVKLKKWNGEVSMSVSYEKVKSEGNRAFLTNRMEWKDEKEEVHAYPLEAKGGMEDGGFEIEIVLNERPETNVFNFKLENWENLDFFYQPPLNIEFNDESCNETECRGDYRPEHVVGSYAVYHKSKINHKEGEINYATGKVYHIYRPKVIDAQGREVWAELGYADGILMVQVPWIFLNTANYPVKVDPTFGYTSIGGTDLALSSDAAISDFAISENGNISTISVALHAGAAAGENFKGLIYDDDGGSGAPGTLTATGASAANTDTDTSCAGSTFQDSTLVTSLTTGTWWLGLVNNSAQEGCRDATAPFTLKIDPTGTFASPENPWTSAGETSLANNRLSVFATYTATGGSSVDNDSGAWFMLFQ